MSKQAIYDQLVSEYGEKFPADAAQYAVDHLDADYGKNALEKAKTYSDTLHMSKQAIYDQLVSEHGEKFTVEEARYAVDNLDADYRQNALEKAKSYLSAMSLSKEAIYDQLVSEYGERFTEEEARYAIDHLDLGASSEGLRRLTPHPSPAAARGLFAWSWALPPFLRSRQPAVAPRPTPFVLESQGIIHI